MSAWDNLRAHLEAEYESVKARVEQDLPVVAKFMDDAAASPVSAALASAVHLPEAPAAVQLVADLITMLDATLGAAKAQGAAGAQQAAQVSADPPAAPQGA